MRKKQAIRPSKPADRSAYCVTTRPNTTGCRAASATINSTESGMKKPIATQTRIYLAFSFVYSFTFVS